MTLSDEWRPLRVLHLDHTTDPGGAEIALTRLLGERPAALWDGHVAVPRSRRGGVGVFSSLEAARIHLIGPTQPPGATSASAADAVLMSVRVAVVAAALRRSTAFRDARLLHANSSRAGLYATLANAGTPKPLVVHLRDIVSIDSLGAMGFRAFTRFVLPRASGVIANSETTMDSALPYLSEGTPRSVIESPLGLERRRAPLDVATSVRAVGMVARLDDWKGHDLVLRAFARVFAGTSVVLRFAGGTAFGRESLRTRLETLAADLGISDQTEFLGHVDPSRMSRLIDGLDICVQASTRPEPLGQNVLQYLSRGRPTIAADSGGPAEWVRHEQNGLLFETGSMDALAANLRRMRDSFVLRSRLSAGALETPGLAGDDDVRHRHREFFDRVLARAEVIA